MKKSIFITAVIMVQLMTQLYAGGDIEVKIHEPEHLESTHEESKFYIIIAGLMVLGESYQHEDVLLEGDRDYGIGIDIGYRLGYGFAVEYDFTYATDTVTETKLGVTEESTGKYYTSAVDIVYTYEIVEGFGVFGKVGYEFEWESVVQFDIDTQGHGFVFGTGIEVHLNEHYKFIAEFEHSLIKGPRGDSLFAGLMYNF